MTPEIVINHFLKRGLPDSVIEVLYYLLLREIEKGYPALAFNQKYEDLGPQSKYHDGLWLVFKKLIPNVLDAGRGTLTAPLKDVAALTKEDFIALFDLSIPTRFYETRLASLRRRIGISQDGLSLARKSDEPGYVTEFTDKLRTLKDELKDLKPTPSLAESYKQATKYETFLRLPQFWHDLLNFNVSFDLPNRNRHCHILGAPGTGKTSLIKKLVYRDMQTDEAVIVMAPKGNLISTLARLPSNRTIWVNDWSQVGLNLLDLDPSLFVWVLESLLESEPTPRQKAFLLYCTDAVKNLAELKAFLKKKPPEEYKEVPASISWRLDLLLKQSPAIDSIFSRETNLDILDVMDSGKVLLLDTQALGEAGSSIVGRFIVALISLSIKKRRNKRLVYVYLDEFPQYITDHIAYMLDMAREANVCLILAHQTLAQLSPRLKASIHNTALKFAGKCNYDDSREMGREMSVDPDTLKNQPDFQFMLYGLNNPFPIKITWDEIDKLATSHANHFNAPQLRMVAEPEAQYTPDPGTGTSME